MEKLPSKTQARVKKAYEEIYSRVLVEDITNAFCEGDEFYEKYNETYGTEPPIDPDQKTLQTRINDINNLV